MLPQKATTKKTLTAPKVVVGPSKTKDNVNSQSEHDGSAADLTISKESGIEATESEKGKEKRTGKGKSKEMVEDSDGEEVEGDEDDKEEDAPAPVEFKSERGATSHIFNELIEYIGPAIATHIWAVEQLTACSEEHAKIVGHNALTRM